MAEDARFQARPGDKRIDINAASVEELMQLRGIDEARARRIVAHRDQFGGFVSLDELETLEGLSGVLTGEMRDALTVGPRATRH